MNDVEDTTLVGLSDDFSILRRLAKKADAVYESAAKDTKFPLMKFLNGDVSDLPMAPPSSRNMRAAAPVAMESTGRLELSDDGSLTFGDSSGHMPVATEVPNAEV